VVPHIRTLLAAEPFDRPHRDPWTDRMLLVFRRHAGKPLLSLSRSRGFISDISIYPIDPYHRL
jgi:hypothetical protein